MERYRSKAREIFQKIALSLLHRSPTVPWIMFVPLSLKKVARKQYGVLITCMASRAIHLKTANSPETDSFINILKRFIGCRGPICQLRSHQGKNFVGAHKELTQALAEMDHEMIKSKLFSFKMNVPTASHVGGVWELCLCTASSPPCYKTTEVSWTMSRLGLLCVKLRR